MLEELPVYKMSSSRVERVDLYVTALNEGCPCNPIVLGDAKLKSAVGDISADDWLLYQRNGNPKL